MSDTARQPALRTVLAVALGAAVSAAVIPIAAADNADDVAGQFTVKYEEVTSNCEKTGMALTRGSLEIKKRKAQSVDVAIDRVPVMVGSATKGGRVKATSKLGKSSIQGLDGRFSIAGTVNADGVLQMVFVAEYYLEGKAYCTQSWNLSGVRGGAAEKGGKNTSTGAAELRAFSLF